MRGAELPDEWIVRGNHHDAWVNGAKDPVSGMVAVMEEARAIGELAKTGWKPKRTADLRRAGTPKSPACSVRPSGSSIMREELRQARGGVHQHRFERPRLLGCRRFAQPRTVHQSGGARRADPQMTPMSSAGARASARDRAGISRRLEGGADARTDLRIDALGSGSDYSPFLQHLGVASLNIGFGGEDNGGSYHSIFDSIDHYNRFDDPGYRLRRGAREAGGRAMLRLANADVLPFQFGAAGRDDRSLSERR